MQIETIDTEWFAGPLYRLARRLFPNSEHSAFLLSSLDYFLFDHLALRRARTLMREGQGWDVVHQVTPVSPWAASGLHRLGPPTIVGPWNGGLATPGGFPELGRADSAWLYPLRKLGRLGHWLRGSLRGARRVLVATGATAETIPRPQRHKVEVLCENAVDLEQFLPTPMPDREGPLELLFVGRLIPFKALNLLLEALAIVRRDGIDARLTVVGDGPMRNVWEREVSDLTLEDGVRFEGQQPLEAIQGYLQRCHAFCLPSVRESGGAVLLEAMAAGRPVIAVDHGGPGEVVVDAVGVKVPATDAQTVIDGLADALRSLHHEPQRWADRARNAAARAGQHSWDARIDRAWEIYDEVAR